MIFFSVPLNYMFKNCLIIVKYVLLRPNLMFIYYFNFYLTPSTAICLLFEQPILINLIFNWNVIFMFYLYFWYSWYEKKQYKLRIHLRDGDRETKWVYHYFTDSLYLHTLPKNTFSVLRYFFRDYICWL